MRNSVRSDLHADFERSDPAKPGSDRDFGLVLAEVFLVLGGVRLWHASDSWLIFVSISGVFAASALFAPGRLALLNRIWFRHWNAAAQISQPRGDGSDVLPDRHTY
jgi:hypothetical protein